MKKIVILMFALLPMMAMAQDGLGNAMTPEAIIGACPALPSAKEMVTGGGSADGFTEAIKNLLKQVEKIQQPQAQQQFDAVVAKANENLKKEGVGFTIEDAANDNANVREGAEKLAERELRKLGINKSLGALKANGLSKAERDAVAANQMKKTTGLNMAEAQKLSGMSDEEIMAYMQANPEMASRLMQNAGQGKGVSSSELKREKKLQQYQQQLEQLTAPEKEMDRLFMNEKWDVAKKTAEKWEACEESYPPKTGRMAIDEGTDWIYVWTEAEQEEVNRLKEQCDIECWTLWYDVISRQLGRVKSLLPNAYKANEIAIKMSQEMDGVHIDNNAPMVVANKYLTTAREYAEGYPCDKQSK